MLLRQEGDSVILRKIWDRGSEKGPCAYFFKFSSHSYSPMSDLQLLSYALEIRLSIMELQWPEFFITRIYPLPSESLIT